MVIANNINKKYGAVAALKDVSLWVGDGELFGIIGADGAGKTTLFRVLTTLILADSGTASVNGCDVVEDYKKIRCSVGYMPGRFSLYQDLSVEENINFFAALFGTTLQENYDLIKDIYVHIEPFKTRRAGKLSGGMKQKLALCCALIHRPEVLFLDEPTTGVDPVSRAEFWQMLKRLKNQGITVIVSTPYMDEATMCDRVALMSEGAIMQIDTPQNMVSRFEDTLFQAKSKNMYRLLLEIRKFEGTAMCYSFGQYHHILLKSGADIEQLKLFLENSGHFDVDISNVEPNVEDCFMKLSNR